MLFHMTKAVYDQHNHHSILKFILFYKNKNFFLWLVGYQVKIVHQIAFIICIGGTRGCYGVCTPFDFIELYNK